LRLVASTSVERLKDRVPDLLQANLSARRCFCRTTERWTQPSARRALAVGRTKPVASELPMGAASCETPHSKPSEGRRQSIAALRQAWFEAPQDWHSVQVRPSRSLRSSQKSPQGQRPENGSEGTTMRSRRGSPLSGSCIRFVRPDPTTPTCILRALLKGDRPLAARVVATSPEGAGAIFAVALDRDGGASWAVGAERRHPLDLLDGE
jgi:hypothetical protein